MQKPMSRQELSETLVELGLLPVAPGKKLRFSSWTTMPEAVELMAVRTRPWPGTVLAGHTGGREAIGNRARERPD
jgi:hypothetical protein